MWRLQHGATTQNLPVLLPIGLEGSRWEPNKTEKRKATSTLTRGEGKNENQNIFHLAGVYPYCVTSSLWFCFRMALSTFEPDD
jgi:hypothetical protein